MLNTTTSRRLFMTAAVAGGFLGKAQEQQEGEWGTHERDTWIRLIDDERGGFLVGVRTSVKADLALVAVFYDLDYPAAVGGKLLLSKESVAPIVRTRRLWGHPSELLRDTPRQGEARRCDVPECGDREEADALAYTAYDPALEPTQTNLRPPNR